MKIAFLIPPTVSGKKNGVVSQALTWKDGLELLGVSVELISPWESYDWASYDVIHAFSFGHYLSILPLLKTKGARKIVVSPIYDSNRPAALVRVMSRLDFPIGGLKTNWAALRASIPSVDSFLVRSNFEAQRVEAAFAIRRDKIVNAPLAMRFNVERVNSTPSSEPICSHVSTLSAGVKNVDRLVSAALKYGFPLHLAGQIMDEGFRRKLLRITNSYENIVYHGPLSDDELTKLYRKSRVFALPSLMEGVGLVGLEAAAHGADVVITERGGPKEYYAGMALTVDPESVDEIGIAVMKFLDGQSFQPELSGRIKTEFSIEASAGKLLDAYHGHACPTC